MPTLVLSPTIDGWINAAATTTSYTPDATIYVKNASGGLQRKGVMCYDLSAMPVGATVTAASLTWYVTTASGAGSAACKICPLEIYGGGDEITSGLTWDTRNGSLAWTTPGGDFLAVEFAAYTAVVSETGLKTVDVLVPVLGAIDIGNLDQIGLLNFQSSGVGREWQYQANEGAEQEAQLTLTYTTGDIGVSSPVIGDFRKSRIYSLISVLINFVMAAFASAA